MQDQDHPKIPSIPTGEYHVPRLMPSDVFPHIAADADTIAAMERFLLARTADCSGAQSFECKSLEFLVSGFQSSVSESSESSFAPDSVSPLPLSPSTLLSSPLLIPSSVFPSPSKWCCTIARRPFRMSTLFSIKS